MDKQDRLKKMLEIATEDRPSTKEVASLIAQVINTVKEVQKTLKSDMELGMKGCEKMCNDVENSLGSLESKLTTLISKSSKESNDKAYKDLNNEVYKLEKLIRDIPQFDSSILESKWSTVIGDLDSKISQWKQLTATEIRDSLESITNEEEKLDFSAIKGGLDLKKEVERIKKDGGKGVVSVAGNVNGVDIYVDGVFKATSRYLNFIAGSGMVISQTNIGERTDILFSASSSSTFTKLDATGTVDGSNTAFTFTTAPQIIVVDGRGLQKTQSDGTVNWTGTTSVTLTIAPNFDIYGY